MASDNQEDIAAQLRRIAGQTTRTPGVRPLSSRPVALNVAGTRAQHLQGLRDAAIGYGSKDAGGLGLSRRSQEIRAGRAQSRYAMATNRYKALPAPKARLVALGPASVNITPAVSKLGGAAAAALAQTSLNVGDAGPRNFAKAIGGRTSEPARASAPRIPALSAVDPRPRATAPPTLPTAPMPPANVSAVMSGSCCAERTG